jgi:threonylcarbamoyladenosine tRNA methylthiotransferase MtaB
MMSGGKVRVAFHTLGCKLNYTETSTIARSLDTGRYENVSYDEPADIYVINTCTVTGAADRKCRQAIRKASRQAPDAKIVVMGCFAQLHSEEAAALEGVRLILGNQEKFHLARYLDELAAIPENESAVTGAEITGIASGPIVHSCESMERSSFISSFSMGDRTRAFMKVQDGCDYHCSYCTIPLARGASRNQPVAECVREAQVIAGRGIREIVLTGINTGDFGKSTGESLYELLQELIKVEGIERYRISSIEPNLLTTEIIELTAASEKLMPHFHIPLQSGCNETLARMRRRYRRELFEEKTTEIKRVMPHASIGADVIAGFPGETDEEFMSTYKFLENIDLSYLHAFTYSPRSNTPAALMKPVVKSSDATKRSHMLQELSGGMARRFALSNKGLAARVLWESRDSNGVISGFTANYLRVATSSLEVSEGEITDVILTEPDNNGGFTVQDMA